MTSMSSFCGWLMSRIGKFLPMTHLRSNAASRTLTVVLPESDWQALRAVEPDAVGWLHERSVNVSATPRRSERTRAAESSTPDGWNQDEY